MASLVKIVAILGCVLVIGVLPQAVLQDTPSLVNQFVTQPPAVPSAGAAEANPPDLTHSSVSEPVMIADWQSVEQGSLVFKSDNKQGYRLSPAVNSKVDISVTGMIARARVEQTFINPSDEWIHARYVFPLPENAAVDHLKMRVGERVIEGQIKPKETARKIFERAKSEGKKASLVAQNRDNIFTNRIANVAPGEQVVVTVEYQQTVQFSDETFSLRFPMTVAPRYIPGKPEKVQVNSHGWAFDTDLVADASDITPPVKGANSRPNNIVLSVDLKPGFAVEAIDSAYHTIETEQQQNHGYKVRLSGETIANRDFALSWKASSSASPRSALFTQIHDGQQYSLLMALPPSAITDKSPSMDRDVVFILDTSGSMAGDSIAQAKQALMVGVDRLNENDRFNLIEFNSYARQLWQYSQLATAANKHRAKNFIQGLKADGGTEILPALQLALGKQNASNDHESARLRQVLFLTDGSVGNEDMLMAYIHRHLQQSRLFTIGIGSAPNSYFMSEAAAAGRGNFTYIGSTLEVNEKMQALFAKLENPAMTDIRVDVAEDTEFYPYPLPDLYQGQPLMMVMRTRQPVEQVTIAGNRNGQEWTQQLKTSGHVDSTGLNVHWARQKIQQLSRDKRRADDPGKYDEEILKTAMNHHIVSSMTSLVAVDVTPVNKSGHAADKSVPAHLPAGWDKQRIFGQLPQTSTSARWQVLLGAFILSMAVCCRWFIRV